MPTIDPAREKLFHNEQQIYTKTDKQVQYRQLWVQQNTTDRTVNFDLKATLGVLMFEPHPPCWDRGAFAAALPEYQAALLKIARLITQWTGIEVMHRRLVVQQITRCLASRRFTVIVYEPIRRVTQNGAICIHLYKYELEFLME